MCHKPIEGDDETRHLQLGRVRAIKQDWVSVELGITLILILSLKPRGRGDGDGQDQSSIEYIQ